MAKLDIGIGEDFPVEENKTQQGCASRHGHRGHDRHRHGHHHGHEEGHHHGRFHAWLHARFHRGRDETGGGKSEEKDAQ